MTATDIDDPRVREQGYLPVEDLLTPAECHEIGDRLLAYARRDLPAPDGLGLQQEPAVARSGQQVEPGQDIRKISGLWADDLIRQKLITRPVIVRRIQAILGDQLWLFRADALMKPGKVGSEKGFHQDSPYWPIEPMSLWSCWLPLDDATVENGCMLVIPGSQAGGGLPHEQTQDDYVIPSEHYDLDAVVPVPMRRGSGPVLSQPCGSRNCGQYFGSVPAGDHDELLRCRAFLCRRRGAARLSGGGLTRHAD